jgi:hypothetical protein
LLLVIYVNEAKIREDVAGSMLACWKFNPNVFGVRSVWINRSLLLCSFIALAKQRHATVTAEAHHFTISTERLRYCLEDGEMDAKHIYIFDLLLCFLTILFILMSSVMFTGLRSSI